MTLDTRLRCDHCKKFIPLDTDSVLVPGDETGEFQICHKCSRSHNEGHWANWLTSKRSSNDANWHLTVEGLKGKANELALKHWGIEYNAGMELVKRDWKYRYACFTTSRNRKTRVILSQKIVFSLLVNLRLDAEHVAGTLLHELVHWYLFNQDVPFHDDAKEFVDECIRVGAPFSMTKSAQKAATRFSGNETKTAAVAAAVLTDAPVVTSVGNKTVSETVVDGARVKVETYTGQDFFFSRTTKNGQFRNAKFEVRGQVVKLRVPSKKNVMQYLRENGIEVTL